VIEMSKSRVIGKGLDGLFQDAGAAHTLTGDAPEKVRHPAHYGGADDPYEAIKVIEAWGAGFNVGSALKYLRRAGRKSGESDVVDLEKALFYIQREIDLRKGKRPAEDVAIAYRQRAEVERVGEALGLALGLSTSAQPVLVTVLDAVMRGDKKFIQDVLREIPNTEAPRVRVKKGKASR
jgi:hypothetical protein